MNMNMNSPDIFHTNHITSTGNL